MEVFYITCISLLGFFLLFVIIKSQISGMMETRLKALYKDKIAADIQDIYRELESYSAIIDSRIGRLKTLTERHEANIKAWENIQIEMKKSKTGKEFLSYVNEHRQNFKPDQEFTKNLKDEITGELKKYLAAKLNLPADSKNIPAKSATPDGSFAGTKTAVNSTLNKDSRSKLPAGTLEEGFDSEVNMAELIIDDLDAMEAKRVAKTLRRPSSENANMMKKPVTTNSMSTVQARQANPDVSSSTVLNVLTSIGRALSPLFLKSETAAPGTLSASPAENKLPKAKNFNDLLKKEIITTENISQARKDKTTEAAMKSVNRESVDSMEKNRETEYSTNSREISSKNLIKSMDPAELVQLFEDLKISRSRPDALKNLLNQGFKMEQIAELSNVPYSDLELTRNLYHI